MHTERYRMAYVGVYNWLIGFMEVRKVICNENEVVKKRKEKEKKKIEEKVFDDNLFITIL